MKPINEMNLAELAEFFDDDERIAIRLRELHSLTRWIPVEERLPTEKDGDEKGYVLWWRTDTIHLPDAGEWNLHTEYAHDPNIAYYTHWLSLIHI